MASSLDRAQRPLPSLDPGVLEVIRWSAIRLSRAEDAFIGEFRSHIASLMPGIAANGQAFCERMVRSLLWVAVTEEPANVVADALRWVGARNWLEGFPEARYPSVANALVRAVRNLSGSDQFTSIGSAWVSYFLWAQPYLIAGAQQAAAEKAAAEKAAAEEAAARRRAAEEEAAARRAAAEQEAARAQALAHDPRGSHPQAVGDVSLETVADLLRDEDDDDDGDTGYGQIMVSMTRNQRREPPQPD